MQGKGARTLESTSSVDKAQLNVANAFQRLGTIYRSSAEALSQAVENSADAQAKRIWVVIKRDSIQIIDDGDGMVPEMLPDDRRQLDEYLLLAQKGAIPEGIAIQDAVAEDSVSRKSLQWMRENNALSPKFAGNEQTRGMKGVGYWAFLTYAKTPRFLTRPSMELARLAWKSDASREQRKTYFSSPPSLEQLQRDNTDYPIGISGEPLKDPWGRPLEHGTMFEASGLLPGHEEALRPSVVASFFRTRFGPDVRMGKYTLTIVESVSDEARRLGRPVEIEIKPSEYKGRLTIDRDFFVRANTGSPCHIQLWYDPNTRNGQIFVRHKDSDKFELTELPAFKTSPWNTGSLSGFITFPVYDNEERLWDTSKQYLLESPERNQWIKRVEDLADEIEQGIANADLVFQNEQMRDVKDDMSSAVAEAMREVEAFNDWAIGSAPDKKPRNYRGIQNPYVIARVSNEQNDPVEKITLQLYSRGQLLEEKLTGNWGQVSFGRLAIGDYRIKMVIPEGLSAVLSESQVKIREDTPGAHAQFYLNTGEPKRLQPKKPNKLTLEFMDLGDPMLPYRHQLEFGIIYYNVGFTELAEAFATRKIDTQDALLAHFTASAITDYVFNRSGGGPHEYILLENAKLFASLHANFKERRANKRSRSTKRRRAS